MNTLESVLSVERQPPLERNDMSQLRLLTCTASGNLSRADSWLRKLVKLDVQSLLDKYGKIGVDALSAATPKDTGLTAASWTYKTTINRGENGGIVSAKIEWTNTNLSTSPSAHIPIVILIECGHGTRNGGYVPPHPFISDTIRPIFEELADRLGREVKSV